MRRLAALIVLFALHLPALAEDNPLAPGGAPIPAEPAGGPALAGGFLDPDRDLMLLLWSGPGGAWEGELMLGSRGRPLKVQGKLEGEVFTGTFVRGQDSFALTLRAEGDAFRLESGGASYRLVRGLSAARVSKMRSDVGEARALGNEAAAIGALKTINTAQTLFREGDKEQDGVFDYATLAELSAAQLVDGVLGSGTKQGYKFATEPGKKAPEFLWAATASPLEPGKTGSRWFFTNQAGVIYYSTQGPFTIKDDCAVPEGAKPVGK